MIQGKLEVVKSKMASTNIDILGTSELKWTGMGEFNSNDLYIHCCGQESLRRNEIALIVNKSPKCSTWVQYQKPQNNLISKASHSISQLKKVYVPTTNVTNAKEAEVEWFSEDLQDLLELTPKNMSFSS